MNTQRFIMEMRKKSWEKQEKNVSDMIQVF